jgi:hypothetical protein
MFKSKNIRFLNFGGKREFFDFDVKIVLLGKIYSKFLENSVTPSQTAPAFESSVMDLEKSNEKQQSNKLSRVKSDF